MKYIIYHPLKYFLKSYRHGILGRNQIHNSIVKIIADETGSIIIECYFDRRKERELFLILRAIRYMEKDKEKQRPNNYMQIYF